MGSGVSAKAEGQSGAAEGWGWRLERGRRVADGQWCYVEGSGPSSWVERAGGCVRGRKGGCDGRWCCRGEGRDGSGAGLRGGRLGAGREWVFRVRVEVRGCEGARVGMYMGGWVEGCRDARVRCETLEGLAMKEGRKCPNMAAMLVGLGMWWGYDWCDWECGAWKAALPGRMEGGWTAKRDWRRGG
jgi:hypothetical protein